MYVIFLEKKEDQYSEMTKFYEFLKNNEETIVRNARYSLVMTIHW